MSQESLAKLVERASTDGSFRAQLQSDPERALVGCELTGPERAALLSGDWSKLQSLGVDARITKQGYAEGPVDSLGGPFAG